MLAPVPLFSFGVVTDIQYANIDNRSNYRFRDVPQKLHACVEDWNNCSLAFAIQLGDLIQGNRQHTRNEFEHIASILDRVESPLKHVIGNHCLELPLKLLRSRLQFQQTYYSFSKASYRFIVLHSMDVSIYSQPYDLQAYQQALLYLEQNPIVKKWSGGLGNVQTRWLTGELELAKHHKEKVIVFNHLPIHEDTTDIDHGILWNHKEIKSLFQQSGVVVAHFNGHYHKGGYAYDNGIHYVTLEALVEAPEGKNAYGIVDIYSDCVVIKGYGSLTSRTLRF